MCHTVFCVNYRVLNLIDLNYCGRYQTRSPPTCSSVKLIGAALDWSMFVRSMCHFMTTAHRTQINSHNQSKEHQTKKKILCTTSVRAPPSSQLILDWRRNVDVKGAALLPFGGEHYRVYLSSYYLSIYRLGPPTTGSISGSPCLDTHSCHKSLRHWCGNSTHFMHVRGVNSGNHRHRPDHRHPTSVAGLWWSPYHLSQVLPCSPLKCPNTCASIHLHHNPSALSNQ